MNIKEKIASSVEVVTESGCWIWMKALFPSGYAAMTYKGKTGTVHRFSYEAFNGPIPESLCVLHHCDIRECVNPGHLFLGTLADNNADMLAKGRYARGEKHPRFGKKNSSPAHPSAKLTEEQILEIRASELSHRALAKIHGVSHRTIGRAKSGHSYQEITQ